MNQAALRQLFWDIDKAKLSTLSQEVIVVRIFSCGTLDQVREMLRTYPHQMLQTIFSSLKPQALSSRRYAYFQLLLS